MPVLTERGGLIKPPYPVIGKVTHHSAEICWEGALDEANTILKMTRGDARTRVTLQEQAKSGVWNTIYMGYAKRYISSDLEQWTQYKYRYRFQTDSGTSEWSDDATLVTLKEPFNGEHLHRSILMQDIGTLQQILETREAPINALDKYGFTPLMQASQRGYLDMAELLIEYDAEVNYQNEAGKTALMLSAFVGKLDIVKELRYSGATYDLQDKGGSTALHWAVDGGQVELIEWMIEDGADITITDLNGWTPLLRVAAVSGNADVAKALIQQGADLDIKDKDGKTALMISVINGHHSLVQLLLDSQVDLNIKNSFGKTAYEMAVSMEKKRIVKVLEDFMDKNGIRYHL